MSNTRNAILGVIAVSATFGAVQLASGHDLTGGLKAFTGAPAGGVNRAAKADRVGMTAVPGSPTQTISIRIDRIADTSVLVRIPRQKEAKNSTTNSTTGRAPVSKSRPSMIQSQERKATVACEPVVSVLTEIAKRLQPGRCVT